MAAIFLFLFLLGDSHNRVAAGAAPRDSSNGNKAEITQDLLRTPWTFRNRSDNSELKPLSGPATVPGDIYADLQALKLIDEPLYADNDVRLRWVARENWTYATQFTVDDAILKKPHHLIVFDGLDTIARAMLNDVEILTTNNQFVQYTADVTGKLKQAGNKLEINFDSPISYGDRAAREYSSAHSHSIPPGCTIEMYHGECHANFVRKMQAQFAWDWGPAFPTVGIFGGARLIGHSGLIIERVHVDTVFDEADGGVQVTVHADVRSTPSGNVHWDIIMPALSKLHNVVTPLNGNSGPQTTSAQFTLKKGEFELWWPNGMGAQRLYDVHVQLTREDKQASASRSVRIGFRKVELIQDLIDTKNASIGRDFYFKVNGQPVFLKGSNWIPVSPFPARNHSERMAFLLESARVAGMNAMRVWGGGRYETDEFYEMADAKGILLWHDMMFACSLYPTDPGFLESVSTEIAQNVKRLKSHASVLVWAGNNENELGLVGGWWTEDLNYTDQQRKEDYLKLYKEVIGKIVRETDPTRPYLLSSPSNGVETERAGGISKQPGDPRFGDIHFYNEIKNLWKDSSYETPRCATEYGLQSLPSGMTMSKYLPQSDYAYLSANFTHRQHHPGGIETLLTMIFAHFPLPPLCSAKGNGRTLRAASLGEARACLAKSDGGFLDRFAYFTQFHQALTYKTETEHYLRFRGRLTEDGLGHTMCALYWQLNDVWAAPTWSTIDWDLRWKPAHYEARRFFAPQLAVVYLNDAATLEVYAINDRPETAAVTVLIQVFAFSNDFTPVFTMERQMELPPYSSTQIDVTEANSWRASRNDLTLENLIFTGEVLNLTRQRVGYQSTVVPDLLWKVDLASTGDVSITSFQKLSDLEYRLEVEATAIAPFVWVEVQVDDLLAFFDDNAFTMTEKRRALRLTLAKKYSRDLRVEDVYACALKNCYA